MIQIVNKGGIVIINGLEFLKSNNFLMNFDKIMKEYSILEIYKKVNDILIVLSGLTARGFINTLELEKYPIINQFINTMVMEKESKGKKYRNIKYLNGSKSMITYRWIYAIIMINLYTLVVLLLEKESKNTDLYSDLLSLSEKIYDKLEPSIRKSLIKKGITITHNIQNGFDTEYENVDITTNKLLSVQMAVNVITYLRIQLHKVYRLSNVHTLTNESYEVGKDKNLNIDLMENVINSCIGRIRIVKYGNYDRSMFLLIYGLKKLGISFIEEDDGVVIFRFSSRKAITYFEDLRNKDYSIRKLIDTTKIIGESLLKDNNISLLETLKGVFKDREKLGDPENQKLIEELTNPIQTEIEIKQIVDLNEAISTEEILTRKVPKIKSYSRSSYTSFTEEKISVSIYVKIVLIGHLNAADLSMMSDFNEINKELDIVNKSFVTLKGPIEYHNSSVVIRDTLLLAPGGAKSLSKIGEIYKLNKLELTEMEKTNMSDLFERDERRFKEYAIRDSLITLTHAVWMETFNFSIGGLGIPLTLSSIGTRYVEMKWKEAGYGGYQLNPEIMIGDAPKIQTPLGLNADNIKTIGEYLPLYIKNYKGGRNESLMYGFEKERIYYDWDLTSAYTTVLSNIGSPDYKNAKEIKPEELTKLSDDILLNSFTIIKCTFRFPDDVKYPSIPVYVDETTTIYPKNGTGVLTGAEYILARNQECELNIQKIYHIPFLTKSIFIEDPEEEGKIVNVIKEKVSPFELIINEVQAKRREYAKGTISNLMYKEIGNSIYGSLVRGINDKRKYDNKTGMMIRIPASRLSNPILASWVTAYIRSIIGECLHIIQKNKGLVVSVTTDGFITDLENIEKIMVGEKSLLFNTFKELRERLSGDNTGLELKTSGKGVISWTTRGQMGIESKIRATTGFQNRDYDQKELSDLFIELMNTETKELEYIQSSLRSATDISKKGGHVLPTYRDQKFSLKFDNRRKIVDQSIVVDKTKNEYVDTKKPELDTLDTMKLLSPLYKESQYFIVFPTLYDTNPLTNSEECKNLREISKISRTKIYNSTTSYPLTGNKIQTGRNFKGVAVRNFIKNIYAENTDKQYSIMRSEFKAYNDMVQYILEFDDSIKITKHSISKLVTRSNIVKKQVPLNKDTMSFVNYVKIKFPHFDEKLFFKKF